MVKWHQNSDGSVFAWVLPCDCSAAEQSEGVKKGCHVSTRRIRDTQKGGLEQDVCEHQKEPTNQATQRYHGRLHNTRTVRTVLDNYTAFSPQTDPHRKVPDSIS